MNLEETVVLSGTKVDRVANTVELQDLLFGGGDESCYSLENPVCTRPEFKEHLQKGYLSGHFLRL